MSKLPENSSAVNWYFTLQLHTTTPSEEQLSLPKALISATGVIYLCWHLEEWADTHLKFLRGIIRCGQSRSLRQLTGYVPEINIYPMRGVTFDSFDIDSHLKPSNRIGELYQLGDPHTRKRKRTSCDNSCTCCQELIALKSLKKFSLDHQ